MEKIKKQMKAATIDRYIFWEKSYEDLNEESIKLLLEIFELMKEVKMGEPNNKRRLWFTAERGLYEDYIEEYGENYFIDFYDAETKEEAVSYFYRDYPNNTSWYRFETYHSDDWFYTIFIDEARFVYNKKSEGKYKSQDVTPLLLWIKENVEQSLKELHNGTYNERIKNTLPVTLRKGVIKRKDYYEIKQDEYKNIYGNISKELMEEFIKLAKESKEIPMERVKNICFNDYFHYVAVAMKSMYPECIEKSDYEIFESYAEDFGGLVVERELDHSSVEDFERYRAELQHQHGGHPFGLRRGSSRTRLQLQPVKTDDGYYFTFSGNPVYMLEEIVKMFVALKKIDLPMKFYPLEETIECLMQEGYIGIVPSYVHPVYCSNLFPNKNINDFRHFDEDFAIMKDKIEWQEEEPVVLNK